MEANEDRVVTTASVDPAMPGVAGPRGSFTTIKM